MIHLAPYQSLHQLTVLKLETERLLSKRLQTTRVTREEGKAGRGGTHPDLGQLLGGRPVPVPEAGQQRAVDPLAVAVIVQVRPHLGTKSYSPVQQCSANHLGPDGLVQLPRLLGGHRLLGELEEEAAALQTIVLYIVVRADLHPP